MSIIRTLTLRRVEQPSQGLAKPHGQLLGTVTEQLLQSVVNITSTQLWQEAQWQEKK